MTRNPNSPLAGIITGIIFILVFMTFWGIIKCHHDYSTPAPFGPKVWKQ